MDNYKEEEEKSSTTEEEEEKSVPTKKSKSVFPETEVSDVEKNVINKNIEERKQMEKQLGISNIAAQVMKTKPKTFSEQSDDMVDSDSD